MKTSWLAAAGVALALALWMASGLMRSDGDTDEASDAATKPDVENASADDDPPPMRVEIMIARPEPEQRSIVLRGQVAATRMVELRAETAGRVAELFVTRGAQVESDEPLIRLDAGVREALLAGARAQLASAQAEQTAAESLGRRGLQSQLQTEQTLAAASLASAEVDRLERDLENTTLRAPFAGIVERLPLEIGQLLERGDPAATLVDDSAFEVTARAAQQIAAELVPGQPVDVTLITGEKLNGQLTWISSVADAATRSFEIEARIDNPNAALAAGVSASLTIPVERVEAVFLSPSTLTLGDNGDLGVKILDDDDRVVFLPVAVLRTSLDGAWVTGIDTDTRVVTLGQGFVGAGERVLVDLAPDVAANSVR
mgnify:CR=1 FL=1